MTSSWRGPHRVERQLRLATRLDGLTQQRQPARRIVADAFADAVEQRDVVGAARQHGQEILEPARNIEDKYRIFRNEKQTI